MHQEIKKLMELRKQARALQEQLRRQHIEGSDPDKIVSELKTLPHLAF